ncbi:helicase-related protein [Butyrivibrio sp.]|uniref:helicase-related protein n=1 Tax=Butyrivibrio sp. TaxID=28121 RepID=UPI0034DDB5C4
MSTDDYVYNLEVEDVNNYFANGVLVHNCHHAAAKTYRKIYDYFKPRLHLGFTATPARGDHIRLDDIYSSIIYKKDILWGIQNKWLCDINCLRVDIGYDIRRVKVHRGDYDIGQLSAILNQKKANEGIAEAYKKYAKGQTVIFAVSVEHAEAIAEYIEGAVIISASTPNRQEILDKFMKRDIPCLVNCMILTEGTDLPLIETIIIARPTRNTSLYQQMVGRGLRLYPGKTDLTLIDCVGTAEVNDLCTAPSLLGIDMSQVPEKKRDKITGKLTEMQAKVTMLVDMTPEAWILSYRQLNLFMQRNKYDDCGVRYNMSADGSMLCSLKQQMTISITPPDQLGMSRCIFKYIQNGQMITKHTDLVPLQTLFTKVRAFLDRNFDTQRYLWDKSLSNIWSSQPASDKQIEFINRLQEQHSDETDFSGFDPEKITKGEASIVIDRLKTMD